MRIYPFRFSFIFLLLNFHISIYILFWFNINRNCTWFGLFFVFFILIWTIKSFNQSPHILFYWIRIKSISIFESIHFSSEYVNKTIIKYSCVAMSSSRSPNHINRNPSSFLFRLVLEFIIWNLEHFKII